MIEVYNKTCQNCLFSKNRNVSKERANEIIKDCQKNKSFFICHKASFEGKKTMCNQFYKRYWIADKINELIKKNGLVKFINQTNNDKLTPYE
jgi:hypothetical protein